MVILSHRRSKMNKNIIAAIFLFVAGMVFHAVVSDGIAKAQNILNPVDRQVRALESIDRTLKHIERKLDR